MPSITQSKNYSIKRTRSGQSLSTDNNDDEIISNIRKYQRTISHETVARSSSDKQLLNTYNIKTRNEEPNKRSVSKDEPSTSTTRIDSKNKDNVFETVENAVHTLSINLPFNSETCKKRKFIITCEVCEETQCNKTMPKQKYKKAKSMHLKSAQNDTRSFEISCVLDEILDDENDSERLSKRGNISNNDDQSTNGLQKQFDITDGKKTHKRNSKAKVPKPLKKQVTSKRNNYINNDNIASPAKGDLATYVEHFSNNCEVGNSVTPVTTLNASAQLETSSTENFEQPVTYYDNSNFNLVPSNEIVGNLIASSDNSVTYVNGSYNTNSSDDAIQHSTSIPLRNVNIPLYMQNAWQQSLETVYVEPSMNSRFSLMSTEEIRSLPQSMLPKSHSFSRRTPQLSWSKEVLMLEKPLSEDAYKPLNLSKRGRNNSIMQQVRSKETCNADNIIREVFKISKIDGQQSLTNENDDKRLETVYVEPSMNSRFSLMSTEEIRSLPQSMLPKSHSFSRRTPQLSWSKERLMLEKPLSEDAYKPLNLSKRGRNNSIMQQVRSKETCNADNIIREVFKISKIDGQQSLTNENDDKRLETVYVEPSIKSQFSLMSTEEIRSLSQSMLPKSHSFPRLLLSQLSWSKEVLMLEKPLSEDAYKPLNLSKRGRNNSITQPVRSKETRNADDIITEVIKISEIDEQQSLTDENDSKPVSNSIEALLNMPLLDFDERHFNNLLDDVTSDGINPLEGKDKRLDTNGNTGLCSGETTIVTNTHVYSTQYENNNDFSPLSVFPQSFNDFGTDVDMLKFVHLTQSEKDILSRKANSCDEINMSLSDAKENGTIMPSTSENPLYHSNRSLISTRHVEKEVKELNNNESQGAKEFQSHVIDSAKSKRNNSNDLNIQNDLKLTGSANCDTVKEPKNVKPVEKVKLTVESRSKDENILFSDFNQVSSQTSLRSPDNSFIHVDSHSTVVLKEPQQLPIVLDCPLLENEFRMETSATTICNNASPKNAKLKNGGENIIREVQIQIEKEKKESAKIVRAPELILKQNSDIDNAASTKLEIDDLPNNTQLEGNEKNVIGAEKNVVDVKHPIPEIGKADIILNDELDDVLSLAPSSTFGSLTKDHFVGSIIKNGGNNELCIEPYTPTSSMKAKKFTIAELSNNRDKQNIDKEQLGNRQGYTSISSLHNNQIISPTTGMLPKNSAPSLLNSQKYKNITRTFINELVVTSVSSEEQQQQLQKPTTQKLLNHTPPMHWTNAIMNNLKDIFGVTCLLYLKGKCTTNVRCTLSHQFNNTDLVVQVFQRLPSTSLNSLYNYMYANSCLFHVYFKYFCQFYAYSGNTFKLRNIVHDCERYPEYSSELSNVYKAFINCGMSKVNACRLILQRLKHTSSISIISELVVIIVDADWTMFTDYLKQITSDCVKYYFPINLLEQMAIDVIKNPHTSLKRSLGECLLKVQEDEVPLLLYSKSLMKCVELLATEV